MLPLGCNPEHVYQASHITLRSCSRKYHQHGSLRVQTTHLRSLWLAPALQLVDFPEASGPKELHYDAEWLAVLRTTHQLMSLQRRPVTLPGALQ